MRALTVYRAAAALALTTLTTNGIAAATTLTGPGLAPAARPALGLASQATGTLHAGVGATGFGAGLGTRTARECPDVEATFARGTDEPEGAGKEGTDFLRRLSAALAPLSVHTYAVRYSANITQLSSGAGAADLADHVTQVAETCPATRFVLAGYSQGATVTDLALGVGGPLARSQQIPPALADRVAAVITFGNPLGMLGQTLGGVLPMYQPVSTDICRPGDQVCGQGTVDGAHRTYVESGAVANGAARAVRLVRDPAARTIATPAPSPAKQWWDRLIGLLPHSA